MASRAVKTAVRVPSWLYPVRVSALCVKLAAIMIKVARVDVSIVRLDTIRTRLVSLCVRYVLSVTILLQLGNPLVCLVHLASLVPSMARPPVKTVVQAASKVNKLVHHVSYVQSVRLVKVVVYLPV
jgi:hypothetical protein